MLQSLLVSMTLYSKLVTLKTPKKPLLEVAATFDDANNETLLNTLGIIHASLLTKIFESQFYCDLVGISVLWDTAEF